MYEAFYGLKDKPFNLTPDPRFLYLSDKHKEAFAHLLYGIKSRTGFVVVSGDIGTGKTTICRTLLSRLDSETEVAFIFNPCLSRIELLRKINEDFGIASEADSIKGLIDELNAWLLDRYAEGKNCVLVIDEAQNIEPQVLEQIRLLSNLETESQKLLQIVLIGQPELAEHLSLPELKQLNQRVTARYHLRPLDRQETMQYIAYRLRVAGGRGKIRFTPGAVRRIFKASQGVPRVINAICDRALLVGYTLEQRDITLPLVKRAVREIQGDKVKVPGRKREAWRKLFPAPGFVFAAVLIVLAGHFIVTPIVQRWDHLATAVTNAQDSAPVSELPGVPPAVPEEPSPVESAVPDPAGEILVEPVLDGTEPVEQEPVDEVDAAAEDSAAEPAEEATPAPAAFAWNRGMHAAAEGLTRAWNMAFLGKYPREASAGGLRSFAEANQLRGEAVKVTPEQLEAVNLPAFVLMQGPNQRVWTGLLGMGPDTVSLAQEGGATFALPRDEFIRRYLGEAVILWQDHAPDTPTLRSGDQGPGVSELQRQLVQTGTLAGDPTGIYDDATALAVRALQKVAGLKEDGVAGPQFRMLLSSWLPTGQTPSLREGGIPALDKVADLAPVAPAEDAAPEPDPVTVAETGQTVPQEPEPEAEPAPEPEPDPEPDPEPEPEAGVAAEVLPDPAPETERVPEQKAVVVPEPEPGPAPEPEPAPESEPEVNQIVEIDPPVEPEPVSPEPVTTVPELEPLPDAPAIDEDEGNSLPPAVEPVPEAGPAAVSEPAEETPAVPGADPPPADTPVPSASRFPDMGELDVEIPAAAPAAPDIEPAEQPAP